MRPLEATTLAGLWAAIPTPWRNGRLDPGALARNCHKLAAAGVDGIYTTDSDGEFYAIELDEFRQLAAAFGRAMESHGGTVDAAMGVTWSHTAGVIDRINAAIDAGIPNVHVAFPIFMPLAAGDVDRFFDDLATAAPGARWVHYAHPRCGPALSGRDYDRLARRFPRQLVGTKLGQSDIGVLSEIILHAPQLSHFVVDPTMLVGMLLGARGCYSYWCNSLPQWHRQYMDDCLARRWDDAARRHRKLMRWEQDHIAPLRAAGHLHGIIGKARATLSGFLEDTGETRPPYYPVSKEMLIKLQQAFKEFWAEELP